MTDDACPYREPTFVERRIEQIARKNGCAPFWHDGIFGWKFHCGCKNLTHACDQQCSMITRESARRKRK